MLIPNEWSKGEVHNVSFCKLLLLLSQYLKVVGCEKCTLSVSSQSLILNSGLCCGSNTEYCTLSYHAIFAEESMWAYMHLTCTSSICRRSFTGKGLLGGWPNAYGRVTKRPTLASTYLAPDLVEGAIPHPERNNHCLHTCTWGWVSIQ